MGSSEQELPWKMNQRDPRKALKRFNSFLTKRHFLHPPDHVLVVRIVSKPLPDLGERIAADVPLEPEAEGSIITKSADGGEGVARDDAPKPEEEETSIVKNADGGQDIAAEAAVKLEAEGSSVFRNTDGGEDVAAECSLNTEAEGSSIFKNGDVNSLQRDDREGILAEDTQKLEEEGSGLVENVDDGGEGNAAENSLKSEAERLSILKNSDTNFLQPDKTEGIPDRDTLKHEAEESSVIKNSNQAPHVNYISRKSKGVHFSTDGDDSAEEVINVNSKILSKKSNMFFKLFNEMKSEPEAQSLTIQIEASEEEAFSGLLEFIYFSTMSPSSYTEIVNLLMISDEFQALSCAEVCIRLLEMKIEWALSCCELSARVHELYLRELLIKVEKEQKSKICSDIMSHKDELLQLSFDKIEALFCVDDTLKVESEDVVYDFIRAWAQNHYPNTEDRCSAKELHLERLIRFPYLTWQKLEEALQCDIFDQESILRAVNQALAFKVRGPYCRRVAVGGFSSSQFFERCYERTPVMVSRLQSPAFDRCVVYFSLTENELLEMYPVGRRESEDFIFGHQVFSLVSSCKWTRERHYFGLNVTAKGDCSDVIVYVIRFLAMSKVDDREEFQERDRGSIVVANQMTFGCDDLLPGIWEQLLSGNCPFLLGGILHLCIEITCHQQDESYDCPIPAMDGFPRPRHDG